MVIIMTSKNSKETRSKVPIIIQILILALICLIGEICATFIPINCSSPIYDFVIVYILLQFKVIKLEWIEDISNILSSCMLIAFVPATVAIIDQLNELLNMIFPALLASTIASTIVLVVSGGITQVIMKFKEKKGKM